MKFCFIDTETGGLDKDKNPMLQIAGIIDIDGEFVDSFDYRVKPFKDQISEDTALEKNGIKREDIERFEEPNEVFAKLTEMFYRMVDRWDKQDKMFFIGYNSRFDEDFVRKFYINNATNEKDIKFGNGFGSTFFAPSIDVMQMAIVDCIHSRKFLKDFKLATVCAEYGIHRDDWHDAKADIEATRELFYILWNKSKGAK